MDRLVALQPVAIRHWRRSDPSMADLAKRHPFQARPGMDRTAFGHLVRALIHQQVSMAAARTIHGRLVALLGGRVTPQSLAAQTPQSLRAAGVSRQKAAYLLDLAQRHVEGSLRLRRLGGMPDEAVIEELTQVKGIGRWTAEMFLLFHLQRPDVLAVNDLGLQLAVQDSFGVPVKRAARFLESRRAAWSPYGSVASLVLWQTRHRRAAKDP